MLFMITGLPGAGKSLYTIHRVTTDSQLTGREVFYHGIPDLQLPWINLDDPKKWFEVPEGSVVVIDEAQKVFPLRSAGSFVPPHVSEFETHRHRGVDVVLVTQDPSLVDAHVRKLTERHFSLKRPFGLDYAKVWEFHGIGDPNNSGEVKQALETRFNHPKELYGKYKSASVHAVKKRFPLKAMLLPLLFLSILLIGYYVYNRMFGPESTAAKAKIEKKKEEGKKTQTGTLTAAAPPGGKPAQGLPRDLAEYLDVFTPRTPQLPNSAPIYDDMVKQVKDFPRVAGCVSRKDKCWCYTQQGTRLNIRPDICYANVDAAQFDPYQVAQASQVLDQKGAQQMQPVTPGAQAPLGTNVTGGGLNILEGKQTARVTEK
jgi:zona occludens toxin